MSINFPSGLSTTTSALVDLNFCFINIIGVTYVKQSNLGPLFLCNKHLSNWFVLMGAEKNQRSRRIDSFEEYAGRPLDGACIVDIHESR